MIALAKYFMRLQEKRLIWETFIDTWCHFHTLCFWIKIKRVRLKVHISSFGPFSSISRCMICIKYIPIHLTNFLLRMIIWDWVKKRIGRRIRTYRRGVERAGGMAKSIWQRPDTSCHPSISSTLNINIFHYLKGLYADFSK